MARKLIFVTLLCLSSATFATFCPNGFNQINIGDTLQQVEAQCGKPDSQKISKVENNSGPQEWNYYVTPGMNRYTQMRTKSNQQASVTMAIALNKNKVVNITVNSMSLATTTLCGGNSVSVGDTTDSVKKACGTPVFVNKSDQTNNQKPDEMVEYKYNNSTLTFLNGKLQEIK